jgi:signal transduction histidine kinase
MAFGKFGRYYPDGADVRISRFDLAALVDRELAAAAAGPGARHRLERTGDARECAVETDEQHLRYIVVNLLHNAVKYSAPGTPVVLRLDADDACARISVADRGIGIAQTELDELFSPFYRASNVGVRPGSGMGLAIVKRSATLVGASIDVDSALGAGTTFNVRVPRRYAAR